MKNKFDKLSILTITGLLFTEIYIYIGYKALLRIYYISGADFFNSLPNITSVMVAKPNIWHSIFGGIFFVHMIIAFKNSKVSSFFSFFIIIIIFLFLCIYGLAFMVLLIPLG
jgi:hypothetical protein